MNANTAPSDSTASLRRFAYALLIVAGIGGMLGRIMAVDSVDEAAKQEDKIRRALDSKRIALVEQGVDGQQLQESLATEETRLRERIQLRRPMLSANDRSRWCTVRALVEDDMRIPGAPYAIDKVVADPRWDTIDKVKHDGHFYSSKPPWFATVMAGQYWVIHRLCGVSLADEPYAIVRGMLISINVIPLAIYFVLLSRLVERYGRTDWGRLFVMTAAVFGTFLTTFAVVINNHLPGAVCALVALYAGLRIWCDGQRQLRYFVLAGLFSALTAACELPALALPALLGAAFLWKAPRQTLAGILPPVVLVAAGVFGSNWIAFHDLKPPYMHRSPGDNWYDYTFERGGKTYASYWKSPMGIDRGEPSPVVYALHATVGHHGIFSLTPVWALSVLGTLLWLLARREDPRLRQVALAVLVLSAVCLVFYLTRPLGDRNYGGMTSGLRWMFWFAPLWLLVMLPGADLIAERKWTRLIALVLLSLSVLSATYPTWNPWTNPWLYDFMNYVDWL